MLYKEHCENSENFVTTQDTYMAELEYAVACRRRGLMTDSEYQKYRNEIENKIFNTQIEIEKKAQDKAWKPILENYLNEIYRLLKTHSMDSKGAKKGTFRHQLTYLLENINMHLDIPFND